MGASGAGKSTLLDILAQRVPFSQASVPHVKKKSRSDPTYTVRRSVCMPMRWIFRNTFYGLYSNIFLK